MDGEDARMEGVEEVTVGFLFDRSCTGLLVATEGLRRLGCHGCALDVSCMSVPKSCAGVVSLKHYRLG